MFTIRPQVATGKGDQLSNSGQVKGHTRRSSGSALGTAHFTLRSCASHQQPRPSGYRYVSRASGLRAADGFASAGEFVWVIDEPRLGLCDQCIGSANIASAAAVTWALSMWAKPLPWKYPNYFHHFHLPERERSDVIRTVFSNHAGLMLTPQPGPSGI
jgi:hypothetical protein